MSVTQEDLEKIEAVLAHEASDALARLRKMLPHLKWSRCDASDVVETPFRSYPDADLHLLDASDHCVQITSTPESATGLVVAFRSPAA